MGIRFDCMQPQVNRSNEDVTNAPASRGKKCPLVDLMRLNPASYLVNRFIAPGSGAQEALNPSKPSIGQTVMLPNPSLQTEVHCETLGGRGGTAGKRCIVLFHGNCNNAHQALNTYAGLRDRGDLIAVNAPGYGHTPAPGNHRNLETYMASNVKAVVDQIARTYAPQNVIWLGFSLGSAQAAMAFREMPGSHLLMEMPFTNMHALVEHNKDMVRDTWWGALAGACIGTKTALYGMPRGREVPGSDFPTDGLDTEAKLRSCSDAHISAGSRIGLVFAEHDEVMASDMPLHLWEAYYGIGAQEDPDVVHCLRGVGHNGGCGTRAEIQAAYERHVEATDRSVAKLFAA